MIKEKSKKQQLSQDEIRAMNEKRWKQCRKLAKSIARQSGIKIAQKTAEKDDYHNFDYQE